MSVLVNSVNTAQSPQTVSSKSTLFCCCKNKSEDCEESEKIIYNLDKGDIVKEEDNKNNNEERNYTPKANLLDHDTLTLALSPDKLQSYDQNVQCVAETQSLISPRDAELQLKIRIDSENSSIIITVIDALDLARTNISINSDEKIPLVLAYSIHILVLPSKKLRFKTSLRKGPDPYFDEMIKIAISNLEEAKLWKLRFRLYGTMRNSSEEVIGEGHLFLDSIDLEMRLHCKVALMKLNSKSTTDVIHTGIICSKCNYNEIASVNNKMKSTEESKYSELLIGLSYNFTMGRLSIEVIEGFNFPKLKDNKEPDTLINIVVTSKKGEELISLKTVVKKESWVPVYEETFIFKIKYDLLEDITLIISGCHKSQGKMLPFGSFVMGNSNTTEKERTHWNDLRRSVCGDQLLQWHKFTFSEDS